MSSPEPATPRLLIASTVSGTLEAFLLPFARHLRSKGWRVDGMAAGAGSSPACRAAFDEVHEASWSRNAWAPANVAAVREVRRVVRAGAYDIVHVHTPTASFFTRAALAASPRRPVVVYTAHGFHFSEDSAGLAAYAYRQLERLAGRWTDHLIVINPEDFRLARRHRIVGDGRLEEMPGIGVDLGYYAADEVADDEVERARHELGLGPGDPLFTVVGGLIPRKRHSDVLHALRRLGRDDAHLALVGDGPLTAPTRELARHLDLERRVHFLGRRADVRPFVRAASALVLASGQEGLPRSVMEAMSLGTPVVGTDIRGTRDLLDDGRGFLVPVGDAERLARAMARVLDSPEEALARADKARSHVARFRQEEVVALHERRYRQLLER
ncbi:glycosyltransferase family 4 protein [soil metagenome]